MGSFANADAPNSAVGRGGGGDYQVPKKDEQADKVAFGESMSKEYARTDKAGYGSAEVKSEAYGEYREVGSEGVENKPAKTILINQQSPREEIHDDMLELDRELFDLEQGGGFSKEQLDEAKSKLDELNSQMDDLPDGPMIEPAIYTGTPSKFGLEARMNRLEERIDRLEDAAKGKEVPDRTPEGAIRVDHEYGGAGDGHLMDTSMVSLGKDADGYEQFVAYSPSEQTEAKVYYRDEAGNFTTNRNEAVKEFDGVATDPSILPDNAVRGNDGGYYRATREDDSGIQVFRRIDDNSDLVRSGPAQEFYMTKDGDFKVFKDGQEADLLAGEIALSPGSGDGGIKGIAEARQLMEGQEPVTAQQFEAMAWEPQLPEGALPVNIDGDGKTDFHMVSIGEGPDGRERYVAVQEDGASSYGQARPDQQIYVRNEDGSFESLDGEPLGSPEPLNGDMTFGFRLPLEKY